MNNIFPASFWAQVRENQFADQRYGQAVFNAAAVFYPEETGTLSGGVHDPFYRDESVPQFLSALGELLTR